VPVATAETAISFGRDPDGILPDTETIGGTVVTVGDAVDVDTQTLVFDALTADLVTADIDALHIFPDGRVLFSTTEPVLGLAGIAGPIDVDPADVVEYHPNSDTYSIFFPGTNFTLINPIDPLDPEPEIADVNGVSVLPAPSHHLLLTVKFANQTLPGLNGAPIRKGDIVEWDGAAASIFYSQDVLFVQGNAGVDAVHALSATGLVFSVEANGKGIMGLGQPYRQAAGDLFQLDTTTNTVTPRLDGDGLWDSGERRQTDAVWIQPPDPCPCFNTAFMATELENLTLCTQVINPPRVVLRALGSDADGCVATTRATLTPFLGSVIPSCDSRDADLVDGTCVNNEPVSVIITDFTRWLACQQLITERCTGGGQSFSDDFSGDLSNWTSEGGVWSTASPVAPGELTKSNRRTANIRYTATATDSVNQFVKFRIASAIGTRVWGLVFRAESGPSAGQFYSLDLTSTTAVRWRAYSGTTLTRNIGPAQTHSEPLADGSWVGATIEGTGNDTVVNFWTWPSDPDAGGAPSLTNWGAPDLTFTDDPGAFADDSGNTVGIGAGGDGFIFGRQVDDFAGGDGSTL
jgi:hypothetical protein